MKIDNNYGDRKMDRENLFKNILIGGMMGIVAIGSGLTGYILCDRIKLAPIRKVIQRYEKTESFGGTLEEQFRKRFTSKEKKIKGVEGIIKEIFGEDFFEVYLEDTKAEDLYNYSYSPAKTLTPSLVSGPNPGETANATINNQQFRGKKEAEIPKPKDTYRIFITGGSFPYGLCAPSDERTISGFLEKMLNEKYSSNNGKKYEVFNSACPAWSSVKERTVIIDQISRLQPDLVIPITGINDITYGQIGLLVERQMPEGDKYFYRIIKRAHDIFSNKNLKWVAEEVTGHSLPPEEVAKKIVRNFKIALTGLTESNPNAQMMLELQPVYQRTKKPLSHGEKRIKGLFTSKYQIDYVQKCYEECNKQLRELGLADNRFSHHDLSNVFDHISKRVFIDTCHTGDRGNLAVAEKIAEHIIVLQGNNNSSDCETIEPENPSVDKSSNY